MKILFLHGWTSKPGGVKPTYLRGHGHEVLNPALPDEDFAEAVRIAQAEIDGHRPDVIVGSSRGGAVAMSVRSGNIPLVLLCPAWKRYGSARTVKPGTVILHSRADDVIPFADSEELARASALPASALVEVGGDHRLADPESLSAMVQACHDSARRSLVTAEEFERIDIRVGRVVEVMPFPEGRYSTHILRIDFGPGLGVRKSLAKLAPNYDGPELVGTPVVGVVNFPPRQIGKHRSEVLTLGVPDEEGNVVLLRTDRDVPLGGRVY
jgi:export-related chaperone CsaA